MDLEEKIFMIKYRYNLFNLYQFCVQIGLLWVKFSVGNGCILTLRQHFFQIKVSTCWVAWIWICFLNKFKEVMRHMKGIRCLRKVSKEWFQSNLLKRFTTAKNF